MRKIKVLIVEDEFMVANVLRRMLADDGYDVGEPASTAEEAIASVKAERPDIILMDVGLGGMTDGIDAAREILTWSEPRIIFVSGFTNDEMVARMRQIEGSTILFKPTTIEIIQAALSESLKVKPILD